MDPRASGRDCFAGVTSTISTASHSSQVRCCRHFSARGWSTGGAWAHSFSTAELAREHSHKVMKQVVVALLVWVRKSISLELLWHPQTHTIYLHSCKKAGHSSLPNCISLRLSARFQRLRKDVSRLLATKSCVRQSCSCFAIWTTVSWVSADSRFSAHRRENHQQVSRSCNQFLGGCGHSSKNCRRESLRFLALLVSWDDCEMTTFSSR